MKSVDEYESWLERGGRRRAKAHRFAGLFSGGFTGAGIVGGGCLLVSLILALGYAIACGTVWLGWWVLTLAFPEAIPYPTTAQVMLVAVVVMIVGSIFSRGSSK
jgi:hypothetical protein